MKHIYICGDSFGTQDPEYSKHCWTALLAQKFDSIATVVNLSRVCASNLHIAQQLDRAMSYQADYIIYLATSSTRDDVRLRPTQCNETLLDRFVDLQHPDQDQDLTSYSVVSLDHTTLFDRRQLQLLQDYRDKFFDLDLAIYRNELIIQASLARLTHSNIPFLFDRGGFEHASFATPADQVYFEQYRKSFSKINLWDHVVGQPIQHRPYYHIQDPAVHQHIADYYYNAIKDSL